MEKEQLQEVLRLHKLWFYEDKEGARANLIGANLTGANLFGAVLTRANLSGADLIGANLSHVIGNGKEVRNIEADKYKITYTKDILDIGCKSHLIEDWFSFSDEEISKIDEGALDWWNRYKDHIKNCMEMSPAV